jgi:hypothetical protein
MSKPQKPTIQGPIQTSLEEGQAYVDRPVYEQAPVFVGKEPMLGNVTRYYKRIPLRWVKPVNGRLVPK